MSTNARQQRSTGLYRHGMDVPAEAIRSFCERWHIRSLAVFGSYLRDDFDALSDVDFLYQFHTGSRLGLEDLTAMQEELGAILGRKVDLLSRCAMERSPNRIRRQAILDSAETIYAG